MNERGKIEGILSELGRKIDQLVAETKRAGNTISDEVEKKIRDLKEQKEKMERELKNYASSHSDKWKRAKIHLGEAAMEVRRAFEAIFKKSD